jgi:hypothetical protein
MILHLWKFSRCNFNKIFPSDNPTAAFLSTLATFAAGFVVRPFGALLVD